MSLTFILNTLIAGLTIGALYALIALGYTLVYGIIELINFAHGDVFMLGAFLSWLALNALFGRQLTAHGRPAVPKSAAAQDPEAATMMGVDINRVIMVTFLIGSALAGAAGVVWGISQNSIDYHMGFGAGLKAFTAAVLGGIGNIRGAMLGGLLIGVVE